MGNEEQAKAALAKKRAEIVAEHAATAERLKQADEAAEVKIDYTQGGATWNIWQKMSHIQQNLKVGKNRGKGHGSELKYEYRNAQDILVAVKPLLAFTRTIVKVDVWPEMIGVGSPVELKDTIRIVAPRFVARAKASLVCIDTGDSITAESFAEIDCWRKGQTEPEKLSGSADSYASKYALAHLFGIDDNKDADMESDERAGKAEEQPW